MAAALGGRCEGHAHSSPVGADLVLRRRAHPAARRAHAAAHTRLARRRESNDAARHEGEPQIVRQWPRASADGLPLLAAIECPPQLAGRRLVLEELRPRTSACSRRR